MSIITPNSELEEKELKKKLAYLKRLKEQLEEVEAGLTDEDRRIREECEGSLYTFIKYAWKYMDPSEFIDGWHIKAVAEHLQAQAEGEIRNLLINQPPRTAKSLISAVALTPWVWTQESDGILHGPDIAFLYSSYAQNLSFRDSMKARRLISSPWYKKLWGNRFQLSDDLNTKGRFSNNKDGVRIATSVGAQLTGDGGNWLLCDDAHNSVEIESDVVRQGVLDWYDTALSTRKNRPKTDVFTIVMQRLHQDDLAGHILDKADSSWTHLMIPMRYDSSRHCTTSIGFSDPRTIDGELLWPERLGEKEVKSLESALGIYGTAGQLQQSPSPKGGGIIKSEMWKELSKSYDGGFPELEFIIGSCDTAYSEKEEADYSAMTVWGVFRDFKNEPKIVLMYAWQERLGLNDLTLKIAATCKRYKVDRVVIEAKASGISVSQELRRLFSGELFGIVMINPKGDKVARLMSVEPLFADGLIHVPLKKDKITGDLFVPQWAEMVVDQVGQFPKGRYKDLVDTVSMGIKFLRDNGLAVLRTEYSEYMGREMDFKGQTQPLYDI